MILRIKNNETADVVELFANPDTISDLLKHLSYELRLKHIKHLVHVKDIKNKIPEAEGKSSNSQGTIKIMSFVNFMNKLKPYFTQYMSDNTMNKLEFLESEKATL